MYAVFVTGGKQYRARAGDRLEVEKLPAAEGDTVEFTDVLLVGEGRNLAVGAPKVAGGKVDEKGQSKGWNISKASFRAMVDSALGLDPKDESPAAKQRRVIQGLKQLDGIVFVARIMVEPTTKRGGSLPVSAFFAEGSASITIRLRRECPASPG